MVTGYAGPTPASSSSTHSACSEGLCSGDKTQQWLRRNVLQVEILPSAGRIREGCGSGSRSRCLEGLCRDVSQRPSNHSEEEIVPLPNPAKVTAIGLITPASPEPVGSQALLNPSGPKTQDVPMTGHSGKAPIGNSAAFQGTAGHYL